jgi:hypothetical protein
MAYYVVSGEDRGLEEPDIKGWDDDVLERLADSGLAEELPNDGVEVLAVVLGPGHALHQPYRSVAAQHK